jgi:hypothetical protein
MAGPLPLVFGIFGGGSDDNASIAAVADRLDAPASEDAVLRELDHLSEATDRLVADASLDRLPGTVRPDDGPVQKVEALAEAVDRGTLSFEDATRSGRTAGAPTPTSADVVSRVDAGSLASPDAQRLLDTFAASGADADAAAQSLETVLRDAEAAHAVGTALDYVGEGAGADVEMARKRLSDAPEAALVEGVDRLCERVVEADRRAREAEERCRELERAIADATGETDPEVDPEQALADLADGGSPTDDGAADAATAVRRRRRPQSELARTLLDAFAGDDDPEPVLERAVEAIDEAETVRGLVGSVDPDAVDELAAGVETAASAHDGQVASKLTDRVAELRRLLDGAPETNQVTQYAVQNELRFYDRHLLPALSSASASAGTGDAAERVESLVERRQSVSDRWISGTSDYNHSIPLHFLSLVDSLHQEAETALNAGESVRAREIADAGATVLDYVEQLYEQNEYSVMLRRLRG